VGRSDIRNVLVGHSSRPLRRDDLDLAARALENLDLGQPAIAAFLTGSIPAGLANTTSDIDVKVIVDAEPDRAHRVLTYFEGPAIVDVELTTIDELGSLVDALTGPGVTSATAQGDGGRVIRAVSEIGRFLSGEPLVASDRVDALLARASHDVARRNVARAFAVVGIGPARDLAGAVEVGDWATALLASTTLLMHALDAVLGAVGDFYISPKFVFRRLLRADALPGVGEAAFRALYPVGLRPSSSCNDFDRVCESRRLLAGGLAVAALLNGEGVCPGLWTMPGRRGTGPVRRCGLTPIATDDGGFSLVGVGDVGMSAEALALWGLCDGRSRAAIEQSFAAMFDERACDVRRFVDVNLDSLAAVGAIRGLDRNTRDSGRR
jgi:hypothetical protein